MSNDASLGAAPQPVPLKVYRSVDLLAIAAPKAIDSHSGVPKAYTPTATTGSSQSPIAHDTVGRMVGYLSAT